MSRYVSLFVAAQKVSHCGPCSLAYCFTLLGKQVTQDEVAAAAGTTIRHGTSEDGLLRAAKKFGAKPTVLAVREKKAGAEFIAQLRAHCSRGLPAVTCIMNTDHWIAVLGLHESGKFIIDDPNANDVFSLWTDRTMLSNAWLDVGEDSEYYSVLLERADGAPPVWRLTPSFMRLMSRGSGDTAESIAKTLVEVGERAGLTPGDRPAGSRPLSLILAEIEDQVVESAWHWTGYEGTATKASTRRQYRDFVVIAEASGLTVPEGVSTTSIAAQMTAILCAFVWNDERLD